MDFRSKPYWVNNFVASKHNQKLIAAEQVRDGYQRGDDVPELIRGNCNHMLWLHKNIQEIGWNQDPHNAIEVTQNGKVEDGKHRVAYCLVFDLPIPVKVI